jgi:hypothetical protein
MNNFETKLFYYICIPKEVEQFKDDMDEVGDRVGELLNASGRFLNHSLVFYGDISKLNTIFVSPFTGPHVCSYCRTTVTGTGIESLLDHLVRHHRKLRDSVFSCPECISTVVVSWEAFPRHFARTHEASTGLLVVLNQIQTHVRTAWGLALAAFIKVVNTLDISLELGQEPDQVITAFG